MNRSDNTFDSLQPVPVRSCFGGLALYKATSWLDSRCSYMSRHPKDMKYASRFDNDTCEHVSFINCLHQNLPPLKVGVQPDMMPQRGEGKLQNLKNVVQSMIIDVKNAKRRNCFRLCRLSSLNFGDYSIRRFSKAMSSFLNTYPKSFGRQDYPLPQNTMILFVGNSHTRQITETIVCQYSDRLINYEDLNKIPLSSLD